MTGQPTRLGTLQVGRGIAALAVVIFHAHRYFIPEKLYPGETLFLPFNMGYAGVEYFFVLSGFIIMHVHARDIGARDRIGTFAWKRITRVYPVYWLVLAAVVAAAFIVPGFGPPAATDPATIFGAALLWPEYSSDILVVAWTLSHEMLFYLVFLLFIVDLRLGTIVAAALLGGSVLKLVGLVEGYDFLFSSEHFLFLFGALAALYWRHVPRTGAGTLMTVSVIAFVGIGVADLYGHWPTNEAWRAIAYGIVATLAVAAAVKWETTREAPVNRALMFLGDASYSIYLAHAPAIALATSVVAAIGLNQLVPAWIMLIALTLGGMIAGIILHVLVEKPLIAMLKRPGPARRGLAAGRSADG